MAAPELELDRSALELEARPALEVRGELLGAERRALGEAEGDQAPSSACREGHQLFRVGVDDAGRAGAHRLEELGLGGRDRGDVREVAEMSPADIRDDADVGVCDLRERGDLARVVHAELEDGDLRVSGDAQQREGQAPVIVEVALRAGDCEACAERRFCQAPGRRLPARARDRDDLQVATCPLVLRERAESGGRVLAADHGGVRGRLDGVGDDERGRAGLGRVGGEAVPIEARAADREEDVTFRDGAGVDRHAVGVRAACGDERAAHGGRELRAVARDHAGSPRPVRKLRRTSRSSKATRSLPKS